MANLVGKIICCFLFSWLFAVTVNAVRFEIEAVPQNSVPPKCLRNFVQADTLVVVLATVSGQRGDGQQVNIDIKDSAGNSYGYAKDVAGPKRLVFTTYTDALVDVCFENIITSGGISQRSRDIILDIEIGEDARDWNAEQAKEALKPAEINLKRVEAILDEITRTNDYLKAREARMRDTNESTNSRVKYFAVGIILSLFALGAWQVLYLRQYFRSKNII